MTNYKPRKIKFEELCMVNDWQIKIYTISKNDAFNHQDLYKSTKAQLSQWLELKNSFNSAHNNIGFLIIHAGTEGVFSLINWWVGNNMLNTHIFMTKYDTPNTFIKISGDGLAPCIWELEIINHERLAWTSHILKQVPKPDYNAYLNATFSKEL
ncbi:hypothetical protein [uncultured Winogradskyella sp.]|uniref:hypothetical protein n=1 Tax=uncultured Winogradskyella sp. TaxID=395353 RepID=UPI002634319E|nr:hypothetical protein [uncultured Winogradskyella sp.]